MLIDELCKKQESSLINPIDEEPEVDAVALRPMFGLISVLIGDIPRFLNMVAAGIRRCFWIIALDRREAGKCDYNGVQSPRQRHVRRL